VYDALNHSRGRHQSNEWGNNSRRLPAPTLGLRPIPFEGRRAQHHRVNERAMTPPQKHADWTTHGISDDGDLREAEFPQDCCDVVGAIFELKAFCRPESTSMTSVVEDDERVLFGKLFICRKEIDVSRSRPAVQEQECWRTNIWMNEPPYEEFSTADYGNKFCWWEPGQIVMDVTTFQSGFQAELVNHETNCHFKSTSPFVLAISGLAKQRDPDRSESESVNARDFRPVLP